MKKRVLTLLCLLAVAVCMRAQDTVPLPFHEEWDTYTATSSGHVNGWYICKNGISDNTVLQASNLHGGLTTGYTPGSGTTFATPVFNQVPDTFTFYLYGSSLNGYTAEVEFGYIPDGSAISSGSDVCALFVPYDTVILSVGNQWQRTTVGLQPYYDIHGEAHRLAIRLHNSYGQRVYLDEIGAWRKKETFCPETTTRGRDFWVGYLVNGGEQRPQEVRIVATGDTTCTVTVTHPLSGWSQNGTLSAGGSVSITLPNDYAIPEHYAMGEAKGFHVTSTADIELSATFTQLASSGITSILPTHALGYRHVVLDYPADPERSAITGATVTLVATQPNTTVQFTPPCALYTLSGDPVPPAAGTPASIVFGNAGQTYTLMTNSPNASLSGMEITSDKPIAVFHGNQITGVPHNTPSGDFMYEQAWPVNLWGYTYALLPTMGRSVGDRLRVVADSACNVSLSTGSSYTPIADHGVVELDLPANQPCILTSDKPVSVGLCLKGSDYNAEPGDASLLMVPPMERGICHGNFTTIQTQRINTWYVAIATDSPATMTLDGGSIASQFHAIGTTGYSYARIQVPNGKHAVSNSDGTFTAWTYGVGNVESYCHSIGMSVETTGPQPVEDTIEYYDTVCQNQSYNNHGITVPPEANAYAGTWDHLWVMDSGDTLHHLLLHLTVLPMSSSDTAAFLILGDTLIFHGDTLTQAGTYTYTFTAANGCDSLFTLYLDWEEMGLTVSADGICPGDTATITASGTHTAYWTASPPDPALAAQQGQTAITVSPQQTTVYSLCATEGGAPLASVTVGVEAPPVLCVTVERPFIDFDHPVVIFTDCSEGSAISSWQFSDGVTLTTPKARRQFHHPLPDSVTVTLTSCNRYGCCVDTTFSVLTRVRSVWFPNVFTPDEDNNNRFGCTASFPIVDFELHIYNRLGLLVYSTTDPAALWDGTCDGAPQPQGAYTYYWRVRDDSDYHQSGAGTILLLR